MSFNTSPLGPQDQPFLTMRQLVFEATDKRQLCLIRKVSNYNLIEGIEDFSESRGR